MVAHLKREVCCGGGDMVIALWGYVFGDSKLH